MVQRFPLRGRASGSAQTGGGASLCDVHLSMETDLWTAVQWSSPGLINGLEIHPGLAASRGGWLWTVFIKGVDLCPLDREKASGACETEV